MKKYIRCVLCILTGVIIGMKFIDNKRKKTITDIQQLSDKHLALFIMMNEWLRIKQEKKEITDYMIKRNYKTVAIYGMSYVGERLLEEFKNSDIVVKYAIDKNADEKYSDINIVFPDEKLEPVDLVIVTAISYIDEIERKLSEKLSCPVVSLEDILYEL